MVLDLYSVVLTVLQSLFALVMTAVFLHLCSPNAWGYSESQHMATGLSASMERRQLAEEEEES